MDPHFKGKSADEHVHEAYLEHAQSSEIHGKELSHPTFSGIDTAKELSICLLIIAITFQQFQYPYEHLLLVSLCFAIAFTIWRVGRTMWLSWSQLERLHRVMEQERWEIQHHRPQERDELRALYGKKGFEGKLLEEVCDVLMADEERLLTVMLEEEMGYKLACYEHPLKTGLGSFIGAIITISICVGTVIILPLYGLLIANSVIITFAGLLSAQLEGNRRIPACIWNLGICILSIGVIQLFSSVIQYYLSTALTG